MLSNEKIGFKDLLTGVLAVYEKTPDPVAIAIWWGVLVNYEFNSIKNAFSEHIKRGKFAPRPADILELLDLACCGFKCNLNDLNYYYDQGFSNVEVSILNPRVSNISDALKLEIETIMGCKVRVIFQHI